MLGVAGKVTVEMRGKIAVVVFLLSSASGLARDLPTSVTYSLGGAMSGPYRISADLVQGTVSEAKSPPGMLGDRAGLKIADLAVTDQAKLTPKETQALRRATDVVWREGADIFSIHYRAPDPAYEKWRRETNDGRKPGSPPNNHGSRFFMQHAGRIG